MAPIQPIMLPPWLKGGNKKEGCKRLRWRVGIECIPDEVLFKILVRLPAQDIYFGARLVCRGWYNITRTKYFIHKHLEHARYGLLYRDTSKDLVFISAKEDGGEIMDTYKLQYKNRIRKSLFSCWNGLMLESESFSGNIIYNVTNISTHQFLRLPQCPYNSPFYALSAIGYDAASMTYKVVVTYEESNQLGCAVLTVGVDKPWRIVSTDHLSGLDKDILYSYPITTEGFVHWNIGTKILSLNLETEIISKAPSPITLLERETKCYCLSTGKDLSLFLQRGNLVWNFFVMNPGTGEWKKFPDICLEGKKSKMEKFGINFKHNDVIRPCGWLKYPEVLALRIGRTFIIFYNCITWEIRVEIFSHSPVFLQVRNSLVWLGES